MKRSRSGQTGSPASNFRNCVNKTVAISAAPIGRPGCPLLARSTASMASARTPLAKRSCSARSGAVPPAGKAEACARAALALAARRLLAMVMNRQADRECAVVAREALESIAPPAPRSVIHRAAPKIALGVDALAPRDVKFLL